MVKGLRTALLLGVWTVLIPQQNAEGKVLIEDDNRQQVTTFSVEGYDLLPAGAEGQEYINVKLRGLEGYESFPTEIGEPQIPAASLMVRGEGLIEVQNLGSYASSFSDARPLFPTQRPLEKRLGAKATFSMNTATYERQALLPGRLFEIKEAGTVRGERQRLVVLYPLQYNPGNGEFQLHGNFRVLVTRETVRSETLAAPRQEVIAFVVGKQFAASPSLATYVEFKRRLGYVVHEIVIGKDATDAASIRKALQTLYQSSGKTLKYAIIIGDQADVPAASSTAAGGVTDHYFRAIDTDIYTSDINGPDIGVGRTAVSSETELKVVLEKYMRYERGKFTDTSWLGKMAFLATSDSGNYKTAEGTHNYAITTFTSPAGYTGIFPTPNIPGGDKLYAITNKASTKNVLAAVQDGRAIVSYSGHGGTNLWGGPSFTQSEVQQLKHSDALPMVIAGACDTGDFRSLSFGEIWLRHPQGAIMYWGSMSPSYWDEDDIIGRQVFNTLFKTENHTFADLTESALAELWRVRGGSGLSKYYWESYVTFGEPSLRLRFKAPQPVTVESPYRVVLGTKEITFKAYDKFKRPMPNVRIGISRDGSEDQFALQTGADGKVLWKLPEGRDVVGSYHLTASGNDLQMYEMSFEVNP